MNLKSFFNNFHYKTKYSAVDWLIFILLYPLSLIYRLIISIRIWLYKTNILKSQDSGLFVISIGNLTTGGTGKTPVVTELAKHFSTDDTFKTAVISRGYGKKSENEITEVKVNNKILINDPDICGDEALMLANMIDNITILTGADRVKVSEQAKNKYNCNLILLDDAFQHLRIKRDINILLVDAKNMFGNNQLLPLGPLREPLSSIDRSDIILLINKEISDIPVKATDVLNSYNKPLFNAYYKFDGFINLRTNELVNALNTTRIIIVSGIARPEYFIKHLETMPFEIKAKEIYPDHKKYTFDDVKSINSSIAQTGSQAIITTQKDAVKLIPFLDDFSVPVYAIKMKMEFDIEEILNKSGFNEKFTSKR